MTYEQHFHPPPCAMQATPIGSPRSRAKKEEAAMGGGLGPEMLTAETLMLGGSNHRKSNKGGCNPLPSPPKKNCQAPYIKRFGANYEVTPLLGGGNSNIFYFQF